jgi:hypothetical protein
VIDEVLRTGDGPRRAQERQLCHGKEY